MYGCGGRGEYKSTLITLHYLTLFKTTFTPCKRCCDRFIRVTCKAFFTLPTLRPYPGRVNQNFCAWVPYISSCPHVILKGSQEFPGGLVVKDPALSLLWRRFDPWPGNFHMLQLQPKPKMNSFTHFKKAWSGAAG